MFQKLRSYYRVFGFKQTVLKLFRYGGEKMRTDKYGVYTPSKKERLDLTEKHTKVYIFSDSPYRSDGQSFSSECARIFNGIGAGVYYYCLDKNSIKKVKNPPLCFYGHFDSKSAKGLSFEDCIVVLDTEGDLRLALSYKTKTERCMVIDRRDHPDGIDIHKCSHILSVAQSEKDMCEKYYGRISVVILNYNNKNVIFRCLDTLLEYRERYGYEIIVVDNQSSDGSYEEIRDKYKEVKLFRNSKNGCSSGRNIGIANATGDYVIFLDSDQWILHKNWLDVYFDVLEQNKDAGAVGWIGGWFNNKGYSFHTVNNFTYGYMPPKVLCRKDIGYLGTGGMMVEKSLLDSIGGFDLNYDPTCYEDTDISLEIRNKGRELYYCPYLGVGHLPHQTTKSGSASHEKLIKEKGDYFVSKWKKKNPGLLKYIK